MGSEVVYRDDDFSQVDVQALQRQLADLDEAILLAQRVQVRKAELARIYTTLSDNLASQATRALPASTIREYSSHATIIPTPIGSAQPFVTRDSDDEPFYSKTWFFVSCMSAVGLGAVAIIWWIVAGILNWLEGLSNSVSSWWAVSGASVMGFLGLIVLVFLVLMLKGGGGTVSGTFSGRWR